MTDTPTGASAVIVGAGIVGNSLVHHLALLGWRDLVLVDKGPMPNPGGSTGHASNFIFPIEYSKMMADADLVVRAAESAGPGAEVSLATARVVVGGGRGVGGPEGFGPLEELAGLLGGVVGVSRVVTSEGWRPHKQQVGQAGTRISPEQYLACGIS